MVFVRIHLSKTIGILFISLFLAAGCGGGGSTTAAADNGNNNGNDAATLSWQPPTENTDGSPLTDLAGYKIYYGTDVGNYPEVITIDNAGVTSYVVDNLANGTTYYFVLTAFNSNGVESSYSEVVTKSIPPA